MFGVEIRPTLATLVVDITIVISGTDMGNELVTDVHVTAPP